MLYENIIDGNGECRKIINTGFNFLVNSLVREFPPSDVKVQRIFWHLNFYFNIIFLITS